MIRLFDILISYLILIFLFPIILIISILILLFDGCPITFKQSRVGFNGKKFNILKFRTMSNSIMKNGKRKISFLGRFLRRTSLDEIPQFINILYNEMSIVGPRPLPPNIEKKINRSNRTKRRKILPGITGLSQINFTGKNRKLSEKVKLDIELVDNYNLQNYLKIILRTPMILIVRFTKNKSSIIR